MKEKVLMTSFFIAGAVDMASTSYGLTLPGFTEQGIAGAQFVESGQFTHALLVRTAVTAWMIGTYALTKTHQSRWTFPVEKAMAINNVICWGINVLNVSQIAYHIATHIK